MGLAPYGEPCYVQLIKDKLINIAKDGSQLNMEYFNYATGLQGQMISLIICLMPSRN